MNLQRNIHILYNKYICSSDLKQKNKVKVILLLIMGKRGLVGGLMYVEAALYLNSTGSNMTHIRLPGIPLSLSVPTSVTVVISYKKNHLTTKHIIC